MSAIVKSESAWMVHPANMNDLWKFCQTLAESTFVPKDLRGKPGDVLAALQYGAELGLAPMQALQSIAVINGRPSIFGDGLLALLLSHPEVDDIEETGDATKATCVVTRTRPGKKAKVVSRTFTLADAQKAKLTEKDGPWRQYTSRMLQMRARGFAFRDSCADILRGVITREEADDIPSANARAEVLSEAPPPTEPAKALPAPAEGPRFPGSWNRQIAGAAHAGELMSEALVEVLTGFIADISNSIARTTTPETRARCLALKAQAIDALEARINAEAKLGDTDEPSGVFGDDIDPTKETA